MMKNLTLLLFLLFLKSVGVNAQLNLVPNPSFEIYDTCPDMGGQVNYAIGWSTFSESPEYFNACANESSNVSIPTNFAGYQYASTGNAYCGLCTYATPAFFREVIGSQLVTGLVVGQKYFVSLEVTLAEDYAGCATDKIGVRFSSVPFSFSNPVPINNYAPIFSASIITDSINWERISGSFIADSTYNYIMVGNFFDDMNTDTIHMNQNPGCFSYYFVDNLCVSTDSVYAANWTAIEENSNNLPRITVGPNPTYGNIHISFPVDDKYSILVMNSLGETLVLREILNQENIDVDLSEFNAGFYYLNILLNNKNLLYKIILIK